MTQPKKNTTKKKVAKSKAKNKNLEIKGYKEEIKQLKDASVRSQADLINFKRRTLDDIQSNKSLNIFKINWTPAKLRPKSSTRYFINFNLAISSCE